ncbi:DUF1566 domain-containing protein [Labilithrix luteola]|nr:DUF1566 domain-containing protein [Labilithrix luteola]
MRRTISARLVLLGLVVTLPTLADADADQYVAFNRQDVHITDFHTHLVWDRRVGPVVTFAEATALCAPNARVPTVKELLTLVDETPHPEYDETTGGLVTKMIDRDAFPATPVDAEYWTSSPSSPNYLFTVDFSTGSTATARYNGASLDKRRLRCVRFQK